MLLVELLLLWTYPMEKFPCFSSLFCSQLVHFKILGKFSESYGNSSVLQHCISSAIPGTSWKSQVLLWSTSVEKDSSIVLSLFSHIFYGIFGCIFRLWDMADARLNDFKRNKISEMIFSRTRKVKDLRAKQEAPQRAHALRGQGKATPANALEKYIIY